MSSAIEQVHAVVQDFLAGAKEPCVFEPGQEPLPLTTGTYEVTCTNGRLLIEAWGRDTNLVRRITALQIQSAGRLELEIERFGKRTGTLLLVDQAHRSGEKTTRRAGRLVFREWFRRALSRHFAGWRLRELSSDADLEHSLSPAYSRAFLTKGATGWAAIGAAPEACDPDGALAFGLIWLDYLRRREPRTTVEGLALFLPETHERTTCLRLRCLDPRMAIYRVFVYGADGWEQAVDIADAGNLDSNLPSRDTHFPIPAWTHFLTEIEGVERLDFSRDHVSWRVRGLEFARWNGNEVRFGIDGRHAVGENHRHEVAALARQLERARRHDAANSAGQLFTRSPERWLESSLRRQLDVIDGGLLNAPIYGQVPAFAGAERGVIDLLACRYDGRLAVIEVKASEDLQLPMQALDYWMRVQWHAAAEEFGPKGYFSGLTVLRDPPSLYLVAPALCFHPTSETLLRFFSSEIQVERIGLAMTWRAEARVVFRNASRCDHRTED